VRPGIGDDVLTEADRRAARGLFTANNIGLDFGWPRVAAASRTVKSRASRNFSICAPPGLSAFRIN
jgi:hypothetical protein